MHITAKWIWRNTSGPCYNDTIVAKQQFQIAHDIQKGSVAVTADSFYRLFVNDQWVCDGPARGWPEHYYYDQPDISRYLQKGTNEIKLIACYYGVGHFHGIPQQPGLLAQIHIDYVDGGVERIATDASWQVASAAAWHGNTPKISCQMSPAEYYDARIEDQLNFQNASVVCSAGEGPWQDLRVRDVQMLTRKPTGFQNWVGADILAKRHEQTFCLPWARLVYPGLIQANRHLVPAFALVTVIETNSPAKISIDVTDHRKGEFNVSIDGQPVASQPHLEAGRHLLFISHGLTLNHMTDVTVSLSVDSGCELVNLYERGAENPWSMLTFESFRCAEDDLSWQRHSKTFQACLDGYTERMQQLGSLEDITAFTAETSGNVRYLPLDVMFARDHYYRFIHRQEVPGAAAKVECPEAILADQSGAVVVSPSPEGDVELVYDLGTQNIGYFSFEIEAQAGVEVDIYAVEYITSGGAIQFPDEHRNGMTYITRAGLNSFTSLKRRAGRYVFLRFGNQTEPLRLRRFEFIESTYPTETKAGFECSDGSFNKIWDISAHALKLCMEDTFTDCPLYEQTLWVGDARNESLFAYGVFGATDIAKRCIRLAAQSLDRFEMVGSQLPSSWHCILPAWSFLWGISVWDYYWHTADRNFLEEVWPAVYRNLNGASARINSKGLFSADVWNFFDWAGIDQDHRTVLHTSMFMIGAINAAVECGRVLGRDEQVAELIRTGTVLKTGINSLWNAQRGAYPDSLHEDGAVSPSVSQHTSFLALLYDIAEPAMTDALINNILHPSEETVKVGSPFAMHYLYETLEKFNRHDAVIKSVYDCYLPMLKTGATTVWESFNTGTLSKHEFPTRSHCHAWSSAPLYFFQRIILGIRQTSPGCGSFEISPYVADLQWARGTFLTPGGLLEVSWRKNDKELAVSCHKPKGIHVTFVENVSWKGYNASCQESDQV